MISFFKELWYQRCRRLDLELLWPECLAHATNLEYAKVAFAFHCFHDKAWLALGKDHISAVINSLEDSKRSAVQGKETPNETH